MSIYSIKHKGNENISNRDIVKLYLISGAVFVTLASIPAIIF